MEAKEYIPQVGDLVRIIQSPFPIEEKEEGLPTHIGDLGVITPYGLRIIGHYGGQEFAYVPKWVEKVDDLESIAKEIAEQQS